MESAASLMRQPWTARIKQNNSFSPRLLQLFIVDAESLKECHSLANAALAKLFMQIKKEKDRKTANEWGNRKMAIYTDNELTD